ncbi:MAG: NAD(P)/FAD-dependent oxidoreductase, partial [Actinobacteria bacterium]|nr:NAD(P)/FAD-dependent oxidoreductase [Actinomycetota bacterium]
AAGAILAKNGKKVLVLDKAQYLGGRGMAVPDEGYKLNVGGHLLEDSGSGITKIFEYLGKELVHGPSNTDMNVWDHTTETWGSIRDRYAGNKDELKKVIKALVDTPYEELDRWDDRCMREWILQHTDDPGVIDLFEFITVLECMTEDWWDHSASDNLMVRKMHFEEKRTAAYSFWPEKGWDGMFQDLADSLTENGGELRLGETVQRVVIEDRRVKGVTVARKPRILPNDYETELIEADNVISTLPVWHVLKVVPEYELPDWYVAQIRFLAQDVFRICWLGLYIAVDEPCPILDRRELSTWLHTPTARVPGFLFEMTSLDPSTAPEGKYLYVTGGIIPGEKATDDRFVDEKFDQFEADIKRMYPGLANPVWRRRHLVHEPSFGVYQKPGLVGSYRPQWRAPNIPNLYFASETFKSRGIGVDRAARAGLTAAEGILARRLPGLEETFRY